ncbi:MAG: hypothetical protein V2G42_09235 [bacterium JZ-2024 1]
MEKYPTLNLFLRVSSRLATLLAIAFCCAGAIILFTTVRGSFMNVLSALMMFLDAYLLWLFIHAGAEIVQLLLKIEQATTTPPEG